VSKSVTPESYMRKAAQALASAHQLLAGGDSDGACNRAYYAMFDAAHAALLGGHVASELGSSLNKVERLRLLADYTGDPVSDEDAAWAVGSSGARSSGATEFRCHNTN
jgi:HEPN domain